MEKNIKQLDNELLQQLVERLSLDHFNRQFKHRAIFNNRLRTTGGRYLLHNHNIEINPKQFTYFGEEALIGIIKHELCHYHLHIEGKGYKHQDPDFKALLKQVDAPRFCEVIPGTTNTIKTIHRYVCIECKQEYSRRRRINVQKYVCGRCKGKLKKI